MSGIDKYYYLNSYFFNQNDNMNQNTYFKNRAGTANINKRSNKTPIIVNYNQFQKSNNNQGVHTNIWRKREIKAPKKDSPKDSINNIDSGNNNLSSFNTNIHSPQKVYVILKNDIAKIQKTIPHSRKTAFDIKTISLKIFSTSQDIAFLIKNNYEYDFFNEDNLKNLSMKKIDYTGKEVLLYEFGNQKFLLFPQEDYKIIEIKKNEKDSQEIKKKMII